MLALKRSVWYNFKEIIIKILEIINLIEKKEQEEYEHKKTTATATATKKGEESQVKKKEDSDIIEVEIISKKPSH